MPKKPAGPNPGSGERIYESDIIRNATKPRTPVAPNIIPPSWYMNSRAFANARGVQKDLNVPNSSNATTPGSGLAGAATARLSGGGGSSGGGTGAAAPVDPLGGWTPEQADLSKNPIPGYYDTLLDYVKTNSEARPAEYQALADKFKAQQGVSDQQMYDAYLGSRKGTDESAVALGVDPAVISQARDLAMRQSQERSDQALAANQAFLQKAGLLSEQAGQAYGYQFAGDKASKSAEWADLESNRVLALNIAKLQALVDAQNAKKSGGGGGGRRRSGGGSSSGSTGVTETMTSDNPEMDLALMELRKTNPALAAVADRTLNLTGRGASTKAAQEEYDRQVQLSNTRAKPLGGSNPLGFFGKALGNVNTNLAATKAKVQLPTIYSPLINFTKSFSGTGSNPKKKITETTKGRTG